MSRTYRNANAHMDVDDSPYLLSAIDAAPQSRDFGWFNLTGVGDCMPESNREAGDVMVYMYGGPCTDRKEQS